MFSPVLVGNGDQFYFLNSLGTLLEKKYFIEFNSLSCDILRVDDHYSNVANCAYCVLGIEDKERSMEKEFRIIHDKLSISVSFIPSLCHEVSFVESKLFQESYISHVSMIGDVCAIFFCGGLFLVVPCTSKYLSSHASFEEPC